MFSKGKKFLIAAALSVAVVVGLAGCGGSGGSTQFLNIATGGTSGTYYPLGGIFAEIFNKNIPDMNASAVSTGGSVANINMLEQGTADMAIAQNDIVYYAANGKEMFEGKKTDAIRGIAALYPETVQIVTLGDSPINSIDDLKGKRVAVGAVGSGAEANARQILNAYGITYDDIKVSYLSFGEASSALKDGHVDAAFVTAGAPTAAVQDIGASRSVKLIGLDDEHIAKLQKEYPFYAKMVVPADTYNGFDKEISTVAVKAVIIVNKDVSDELGYELTKAIYSNLDKIKGAHTVGEFITIESATEAMPIELNQGAAKYYKEVGAEEK